MATNYSHLSNENEIYWNNKKEDFVYIRKFQYNTNDEWKWDKQYKPSTPRMKNIGRFASC